MKNWSHTKVEILFKIALIYCLLGLIFYAIRMAIGVELPEKAVEYNMWFKSQPITGVNMIGFFCAISAEILFIASVIGMWFYSAKARYIFIGAALLSMISAFLIPRPVLVDNVDSISTYISSIAAGIVIAMSFLPPVGERFEHKK